MSKMDGLRAMREARYAAATARASGSAATTKVRPPVAPPVAPRPVPDDAGDAVEDGRCGHRNISGRTCTRERGHAAKSHRYS